MGEPKGDKLFVNLGASQIRRRLKGFGHGVRKVQTAGRNQSVVIHRGVVRVRTISGTKVGLVMWGHYSVRANLTRILAEFGAEAWGLTGILVFSLPDFRGIETARPAALRG